MRVLISSFLAVALLLCPPSVSANSTQDIDNHWAAATLQKWTEQGWITGYQDGGLKPDAFVTRSEFAAFANRIRHFRPIRPPSEPLSRLKISSNGRFITKADGTPFFWLGDTAWELPHRLNRTEVATYLQSCADHGINVIQIVALAALDGLTAPNAHGDLPLKDKNPASPLTTIGNNPNNESEYDYWDHIDYIIDTAESLGIYVAFLPSWGSYLWKNRGQPADPIFNATNAAQYGRWLGQRFGGNNNIIWVLVGDRIPDSEDKLTMIRNMANGLNAGGGTQIKTYHPWGGKSSSEYFHGEAWLDFNSFQSGHSSRDYPNYHFAITDYAKTPHKPVFDIEPRYEHLPIHFNPANGFFDAYDARQAAYWSVFADAFGHAYGHNSIWQMHGPGKASEINASAYWYSVNTEGGLH